MPLLWDNRLRFMDDKRNFKERDPGRWFWVIPDDFESLKRRIFYMNKGLYAHGTV